MKVPSWVPDIFNEIINDKSKRDSYTKFATDNLTFGINKITNFVEGNYWFACLIKKEMT